MEKREETAHIMIKETLGGFVVILLLIMIMKLNIFKQILNKCPHLFHWGEGK